MTTPLHHRSPASPSAPRRTTTVRRLALAAVLLVATVAPASAADVCLLDSAGVSFVAKQFRMPRKGQCKAFNGYLDHSLVMATGGACATTNTGQIFITLTFGVGSLSNGSGASMDLSATSLTGTIRYCTFGYVCENRSIAVVPCPASRPFGP